jgi:outer membrane protein TolC
LGSAAQLSADAKVLQVTAQKLYAAGEASITELLEAFRSVEEARLSELKLARDVAEARLGLLRTTGTFFDSTLDRLCGATARTKP